MKFLFCSDLHVRSDKPVCRTDDFLDIQERVLKQIRDEALKEDIKYIIIAGDIFHRARPKNSQYLEILLNEIFYGFDVYFIPGQHDLINHSIQNMNQGSIGVLEKFHNWNCTSHDVFVDTSIRFFHFGEEIINDNKSKHTNLNICVLHQFVNNKPLPPWLKDKGIEAKDLCEKYDYDVFVCGDNHESFVYEHPNTKQLVFNCGCITRQKLNEKKRKPNVFIFDSETKNYKIIKLLDDDLDVVTNITTSRLKQEREERISSFVELVESKESLNLDFESNIRMHCKKNKINTSVKNEIESVLEAVKNEY